MAASILLHGPQGSGKTLIASRLARHFRLNRVIEADEYDNWGRVDWPADGAVVVAIEPQLVRRFTGRRIHVNEALSLLGFKTLGDAIKAQP